MYHDFLSMLMYNQTKHWRRSAAARWQGQGQGAASLPRCVGRSRCSRCRTHNPDTPRRGRRRRTYRRMKSCRSLCTEARCGGRSRCSRCCTHKKPSTPRRGRRRRKHRRTRNCRCCRTAHRVSAEGGGEVRPVLRFWLGSSSLSRRVQFGS